MTEERFVQANAWLDQHLSDPETSRRVDEIRADMAEADHQEAGGEA